VHPFRSERESPEERFAGHGQRCPEVEDVTIDESQRRIDAVRGRIGDAENHLVDELRAGSISRREFIRRGTVLGMSMSALGVLSGWTRRRPSRPGRAGRSAWG
jgi:hypothetical protein